MCACPEMRIEHENGKVTKLMPPNLRFGRHNCEYARRRNKLAHDIAHTTFLAISDDDKQCTKFHTEFTKAMDKKGWKLMVECHAIRGLPELEPYEDAEKEDTLTASRDEIGSFLVQADPVEESKPVEPVQAEPQVEANPVWKAAGYWQ